MSAAEPLPHVATRKEPGGGLRLSVSGGAADEHVARFRELVGAVMASSASSPLIVDLTALSGWGHEAQAALLHLVRAHRHTGRSVVVEGLHGHALQQAVTSGLWHLLGAAVTPPEPPAAPTPADSAAIGATITRITRDRDARRPTTHATCQYGHPAATGQDHCHQGHLVLPQ